MTVPPDLVMGLLGSSDENLRALERLLAADIHVRGNAVSLAGEPADVALAERVISELVEVVGSGQRLTPDAVAHSVAMLTGAAEASPAEVLTLDILSRRGKTIRPKTLNQKTYVEASTSTPSSSASVRRAPARPTSRWRRPCRRCRPRRSTASS